MTNLTFYVRAIWDPEAHVYYSESDILGLVVEAETLEEFEHLVAELGPQMIVENHLSKIDLERRSILDLIPSILLRTPKLNGAVAA